VASWAETETVLAADLGDGTDNPRATAPDLLRRALGCLPAAARAGRVALRADARYFAGQLARAAHDEHVSFAIGARRIPPLWRLLGGIADDDWHDAIDMDGAQVAVAEYRPDWWPADTRLLIRRVRLDPEQVPADPRSRRRRTLHPSQRDMLFPELAQQLAVYACREPLPRQQARRRSPASALRIPPGQYGLDVGVHCSPRAWPPGCTSSPPAPLARTSWQVTASAAARP
jgi:hypothetical protein